MLWMRLGWGRWQQTTDNYDQDYGNGGDDCDDNGAVAMTMALHVVIGIFPLFRLQLNQYRYCGALRHLLRNSSTINCKFISQATPI